MAHTRILMAAGILLAAAAFGETDTFKTAAAPVGPDNPRNSEAAIVPLKDGRVMMLMRTTLGGQYRSLSTDGGETWSVPEPTALKGSGAPVSISRMPGGGALLAVWNHDPATGKRNPLTAAVSRDEGETWTNIRNIEEGAGDAWAYPAVTWLGDRALLSYFSYTGGHTLWLRSIPASWFLE